MEVKLNKGKTVVLYQVDIIESERGWGSKIEETKYFDTIESAQDFVKEFNAKNNLDYVPDWYMYAESPRKVVVPAGQIEK